MGNRSLDANIPRESTHPEDRLVGLVGVVFLPAGEEFGSELLQFVFERTNFDGRIDPTKVPISIQHPKMHKITHLAPSFPVPSVAHWVSSSAVVS